MAPPMLPQRKHLPLCPPTHSQSDVLVGENYYDIVRHDIIYYGDVHDIIYMGISVVLLKHGCKLKLMKSLMHACMPHCM